MGKSAEFDRCVSCFAPGPGPGPCPVCGYEARVCGDPCWWLIPGTLLKGRYVVGRSVSCTSAQIKYLGWDLERDAVVEVVEYFPRELVTRDVTHCDDMVCIPGREGAVDSGARKFWEKVRLYAQCVGLSRIDFFFRNNTCYYVRAPRSGRGCTMEETRINA